VIDGRDTKLVDQPGAPTGGAVAVYGVAVNAGLPALATRLESSLVAGTQNDVRGKDRTDPSATARGADALPGDEGRALAEIGE